MSNFLKELFTKNRSLSTKQVVRKKTIISFSVFIICMTAGTYGWFWLKAQPLDQGLFGGVQEPLRKVLDKNGELFGSKNKNNLAKTYPKSEAVKKVRVNGDIGLGDDFDPRIWKMQLIKANGDTLLITLDDIKKLPKTEIVFDFKCIEGWSQVTHWAGVKFSDFAKKYKLDKETKLQYAGLSTPDDGYYVGIDMPSMMHPQTLLCYEMNDQPLPPNQGYPLRLIIPTKYGIKSLKRIGTLYFSNERPRDYWYERGYDYYSGM